MMLAAGPVFDVTGYSYSFRSIMKVLDSIECEFVIEPDERWSQFGVKLLDKEFEFFNSKIRKGGEEIKATYQMQTNHGYPGYSIVHTMFETSECPKAWIEGLNKANDVLVPSIFGAQVFRDSGVKNVTYMPFPIDTNAFSPKAPKLIEDSRYTFLYVGDFSSRKNIALLIQAYLETFKGRKDVLLILKVSANRDHILKQMNSFRDMREANFGGSKHPEIRVYPDFMPEEAMPGFVNSCDCFVSPSRGEGFGIPLLEAMACEKLVISAAWSSCADYIDQACALPLIHQLAPTSCDIVKQDSNFHGHYWAEPSFEHLCNLMRLAADRSDLAQLGKNARQVVLTKYSYPIVEEMMFNFLDERRLL